MLRFQMRPFFTPDDGASAGASGATTTNDGKAGDNTGKTDDATGTNGGQDASKLLTQDQVDRIITDRLTRAKTQWEADEAQKVKDAALPEIDRLKKENTAFSDTVTDLRVQIRERDAKDAVAEAAKKLGATDSSPIWKMVKGDLEYDSDGRITNLDAAMKDAKAIAPQLFRSTSGRADAGSGSTSKAGKSGDWMRDALAHR